MSHKRRIWFQGAAYHITARGNRKNNIFMDDEDFQCYLNIMEEALQYYGHFNYRIASYCLMSNHVHLLIKTDTNSVGDLISRVHSMYTRFFNKKYNYTGHLFQGRYFSDPIADDKQMLETSRYIHLNPVKAKIVDLPEKYKWSSYTMLIGVREEKYIHSSIILNYFRYDKRHLLYKEFVEFKMKKIKLRNPRGFKKLEKTKISTPGGFKKCKIHS